MNPVEFFESAKASLSRSSEDQDPQKLTEKEEALIGLNRITRKRKPVASAVSTDPDDNDDGSINQTVADGTPEHAPVTKLGSDLGIFRDQHEFICSLISPETFEKLKVAVQQWRDLVNRFSPQLNPESEIAKIRDELGRCGCPDKLQELNSKLSGLKSQDLNTKFAAEGVCNRCLSESIDPLVTLAWGEIFANLAVRLEQAKSFETIFFAAFGMPWHRTLVFETLEEIEALAKRQHSATSHWIDEVGGMPRRALGVHRPECADWLLAGRGEE